MAYVNVAEWSAVHVGDWLLGLDDSILPYVQFFVNNQINGCRLLLLTPHDLDKLNIFKVGHQEIILESVELLRQLHYNFGSETLQTIALRLACKSRALFNQLKQAAAAAAALAASLTSTDSGTHNGSDSRKDSHHHHQSQQQHQGGKNEPTIDLSPVSTSTLSSVSDIVAAVKDFISWIDRYPFDGQEKYIKARKVILQLSTELASTAQRDKFVQGPNEVIRQSCKQLADLCDRLVQELSDSLAMQSATLDVVTVSKGFDEELGMHIHSSYSGIHVVGGLKYHSPAHLNGSIEEGDEIIQVNYQTVVGWQLKKLVSSMRQFPTKLILTVKKRPRHHGSANFTLVSPFPLPVPEVTYTNSTSSQRQQMISAVNGLTMPSPISTSFVNDYSHYSMGTSVVNNKDTISSSTIGNKSHRAPISVSTAAAVANDLSSMSEDRIGPSSNYETSSNYDEIANRVPVSVCETVKDLKPKALKDATDDTMRRSSKQSNLPSAKKKKKKKLPLNVDCNGTHCKMVNRIATTRCSSGSDTSLDSISDVSTLYSTDTSDDSDLEECKRRQMQVLPCKDGRQKFDRKQCDANVALEGNNRGCTSFDDEVMSEEDMANDNDSAFYSVHRTITTSSASSKLDSSKVHYGASSSSSTSSSSSSSKLLNHSFAKLRLNKGETSNKANSTCGNDSADSGIRVRDEEMFADLADNNNTEYYVDERKVCNSTQPRTSAEFEALYLRKNGTNSSHSLTPRASTLPPNTQPNVMIPFSDGNNTCTTNNSSNSSKCKTVLQSSACNNTKGQANGTEVQQSTQSLNQSAMTSIQLSTITHLTSLAKNIRFANTVLLDNVQNGSASSLVMNAVAVAASAPHAKSKFDSNLANQINQKFNQLTGGDLLMGNHEDELFIYKSAERNANRTGVNSGGSSPTSETNIERVPSLGTIIDQSNLHNWTKIRVVLKDNCLYSYSNNSSTACFELPVHLPGYYILVDKNIILEQQRFDSNNEIESPLYIFKLVTYHRLFMFAVDSLSKLALWIVRFGYRFCCNPNETQLCFTYYLSPAHANDIYKNKSDSLSGLKDDKCDFKTISSSKTNSNVDLDQESSDYHELLCGESTEFINEKDVRVKFEGSNDMTVNGKDNTHEESARRFAKSPHPRGSARFAVRPKQANQDFIDSIVDSKKALAETFPDKSIDLLENHKPSSSQSELDASSANVRKPIRLPELPPRSDSLQSNTLPDVACETVTNTTSSNVSVPRPKPRISKMSLNSQISNTEHLSPKSPQLVSGQHNRLAPIPVPEKSAAISQTIQHFANLQRQNNLRRSFAQQQQQQQQKNPVTTSSSALRTTSMSTTANVSNIKPKPNPDYDYITNRSPVCFPPSNTSTDYTNKSSLFTTSSVGNPLYSQLPLTIPQANEQDIVPKTHSSIPQKASSSESSDCNEDDDEDSLDSPLSPPLSKPPPPPVVCNLLRKPKSIEKELNILEHKIVDDVPFGNNMLSSPRIQQTKRKKHSCSSSTMTTNVDVHTSDSANQTKHSSPPVLLPRRSKTDGEKMAPPPLPKTAHPTLSKSNSIQSNNSDSQPKPKRDQIPPPITPKPDHIKPNSGKLLNRSLSDAAYGRQSHRNSNKQRKSLESSAVIDLLISRPNRQCSLGIVNDDEDDGLMERLSNCTTSKSTVLHNDMSTEQLNTSNRSLPTMGVSMLAKKRLSNVSADCFAIEKAITQFQLKQKDHNDGDGGNRIASEWNHQIDNSNMQDTHQRLLS